MGVVTLTLVYFLSVLTTMADVVQPAAAVIGVHRGSNTLAQLGTRYKSLWVNRICLTALCVSLEGAVNVLPSSCRRLHTR